MTMEKTVFASVSVAICPNFRVIASVSVAIPSKKYAAYTPPVVPRDCRGTSCLAMTTKKHFSLTLNMPYFPLYVILSMSSEQTCLQGFANDDIHKAQAFCKNAKR